MPRQQAVQTGSFRRAVGRTLNQQILRRRVQQAMALLRTSDLPLPDVAARSGFSSANHLTRVFKSSMGRSPGSYRSARNQDDATSA